MNRFLVLILLAESFIGSDSNNIPKVHLNDGVVTGTIYQTVYGRSIYGFFGVPYAAPPIGDNRFESPKSVKPWIGEWNATILPTLCLQYTHINYAIVGEEDCLYLNIYTPELPSEKSKLLNVVVYFHGGAFMFGSGNEKKADHLLKQNDIVYVSVNYRVGTLGFLSTGDEIIPGNFGLKDQSKALQWIRSNIANFGGNPSQVTITGMSAGGASVHYHFLSPMSEGLFQRGVSQSGCTLVSWAQPKNVPEKSKRLANLLGCPTHCTKQMLKCLKARPARRIVESVKEFMPWRYNPYSPFGPVVEPPGPKSFLSEKPIDIIRQDFLYDDQLMKEVDENWNNIAPHLMDYNYTVAPELINSVNEQIRQHFLGNEKISPANYKPLTKLVGDRLFTAYIEFAIREQAKFNSAPIYYYKFNYRGKYSLSEFYSNRRENCGVSHGDDLQYVLKVSYGHPHEEATDQKMVDFMLNLWLSFIDSGKPQIENISWSPVSKTPAKDGITYLQINSPFDARIENSKDTSVFDFWNSLLHEYDVQDEPLRGDEL
ncbi:esterase FE4-like isoform X2 [Planococcus citri]|uniref:esterase FE4-like isoform X2 n=1 Tax=Planococcus citri TaxID=170843 RepID=UPI0031FA4752